VRDLETSTTRRQRPDFGSSVTENKLNLPFEVPGICSSGAVTTKKLNENIRLE